MQPARHPSPWLIRTLGEYPRDRVLFRHSRIELRLGANLFCRGGTPDRVDRRSRLDLAELIYALSNTHIAFALSLLGRRFSPFIHSRPTAVEAVSCLRVYRRGARYAVRHLVASSSQIIVEAIEHA
jgi:hypothetical protein